MLPRLGYVGGPQTWLLGWVPVTLIRVCTLHTGGGHLGHSLFDFSSQICSPRVVPTGGVKNIDKPFNLYVTRSLDHKDKVRFLQGSCLCQGEVLEQTGGVSPSPHAESTVSQSVWKNLEISQEEAEMSGLTFSACCHDNRRQVNYTHYGQFREWKV